MDMQRLRAIARDLMEIPDMADDFRYFVESFAVMLSDDTLTLDAAKAVVGREPDRLTRDEFGERGYWFENGEWFCEVSSSRHLVRAHLPKACYDNPTIGQFACLVAAARMGEKA